MKPIKVSQANSYIKRILQSDPVLSNISIQGEISNMKYHSSGHLYFTLKDATSKINCFMPFEKAKNLRYVLEDGMETIGSGYIYVYEKGGSYSLNVVDIQIEGAGNLTIAFEKLKLKLEKEGIFDEQNKKPLPAFPQKIAVITSETGAALQDILRTVKNKNNYVNILIYPCLVQGKDAAADIAASIQGVNSMFPEVDVIILGRGGGSMEELWAFNEELVARSIFASNIPIISAVGHETDFTISDFASDCRAATPTAAAELAVPNTAELKLYLTNKYKEMQKNMSHLVAHYENYLERMFLDMKSSLNGKIHVNELKISKLKATLDAMSPKTIMAQGYGAVLLEDGTFVKSSKQLKESDPLRLIISDGTILCHIDKILVDK